MFTAQARLKPERGTQKVNPIEDKHVWRLFIKPAALLVGFFVVLALINGAGL